MDLGLDGKRALVTGSTAGIGLATARALAAEGASVTVNGRTAQRVNQAVKQLKGEVAGARVQGIAADLGGAAGCAELVRQLPLVDILVNNLGIFEPVPFQQIRDADWFRFFETNVLSGVRLSRHYIPGMRERNWGRVVFVSSESAVQIPAEMIHYGMTKTAQLAVARGLAESLVGSGVTVNSVLPGVQRRPKAWASSSPDWRPSAALTGQRQSESSSPRPGRPRFSSVSQHRMRWRP